MNNSDIKKLLGLIAWKKERIDKVEEQIALLNDNKEALLDDIEQIDNLYTNETSNGLTYAVERFKEYSLAGHVTFTKGERSRIATLASKIL